MHSRQDRREHDRPWFRASLATRVVPLIVLAALAGGCGEAVKDQASSLGTVAKATATPEPAKAARDTASARRLEAQTLYRSARRALAGRHYAKARRLAIQSRRLHKTAAAGTVLHSANAKLAAADAAARERRRLERIARDARTCSSAEKLTVRADGGIPPGCATYASDLATKRAEREAAKAQKTPEPSSDCDPNYTGACLKPDSPDYDCEGGSGNGPDYTGPVQSVGSDPYDLDRDGDGSACEG